MQNLYSDYNKFQQAFKETYHGVCNVGAGKVACYLHSAIQRAVSAFSPGLPPIFVVLLMYCHSCQTAAAIAAADTKDVRMLLVSTKGQWPGSETCNVLQAVLDVVDYEQDPQMECLIQVIKKGLKRDYDTATLHSLTQGHGSHNEPETSWDTLLDFTLV